MSVIKLGEDNLRKHAVIHVGILTEHAPKQNTTESKSALEDRKLQDMATFNDAH
jgi:hypothetical protein